MNRKLNIAMETIKASHYSGDIFIIFGVLCNLMTNFTVS